MRRSTHDERSQTRATALTLLDAPTLDQQQALVREGLRKCEGGMIGGMQ